MIDFNARVAESVFKLRIAVAQKKMPKHYNVLIFIAYYGFSLGRGWGYKKEGALSVIGGEDLLT